MFQNKPFKISCCCDCLIGLKMQTSFTFNSLYSCLETLSKVSCQGTTACRTYILTEASLTAHWLAPDRELGAPRVQIWACCLSVQFFFYHISHPYSGYNMPTLQHNVKLNQSFRSESCNGKNDILRRNVSKLSKFYCLP